MKKNVFLPIAGMILGITVIIVAYFAMNNGGFSQKDSQLSENETTTETENTSEEKSQNSLGSKEKYYEWNGYVTEEDAVLDEKSVTRATNFFKKIQEDYLTGTNCTSYYAVIPDKNYYLKKTPIVFETNFPEYIMEAVNTLNCAYYLVKPFNEKHILAMLSKVLNNVTSPSLLYFRNSEGIETHIAISDIVFIKSLRHNIEVCTKHKTLNFANYSLTQLEEDAASILVRCHKSYLISLKYVSDIDKSNNYVTLSANDKNITIPIGRKYANNLYERTTQ